ncbi:MAG: hypothetical protein GMKNLPBB_01397 [Myxococcota bacterium]|nr:hypothetical protein [Myxococcota bacterium]
MSQNFQTPDWTGLEQAHDRFSMAKVIARMPDQFRFALKDPAFPAVPAGQYDQVVVAAMGGSALPASCALAVLDGELHIPFRIATDYHIPGKLTPSTLAFAISFSGNTEETLASYSQLRAAGVKPVVITAGGTLAELARKDQAPLVIVPKDREPAGFQPRCATGYLFTYMMRALWDAGVAPAAPERIAGLADFLQGLDLRPRAQELALRLQGKIPLFYTATGWEQPVARILKIKINEHAKHPAFFASIPEANHNEMIGMTGACGEYCLVYVRDPDSRPDIHLRFDTMRNAFAAAGHKHVSFEVVDMIGETAMEKVFSVGLLGEWTAWSLALLKGIDPTPVDLVESFKKMLQQSRK